MRKLRLTPAVVASGGTILALVIVAFVVMLVSIVDQRDTSMQVNHADQRIALANELERRVIDIETGQRGFVITGQARFLQPRQDALQALPTLQTDLLQQERADGDPRDVALLGKIYAKLDSYIRDYSQPLVAAGATNVRSARAIVETGEGKRRVDAMRSAIEVFVSRESAKARASSGDASHSASVAVALAIAGLFFVPLFVIALVAFISRTVADPVREASRAAERLRSGDLTVRVKERGIGEARALGAAFNDMAASMQHSRDELESQNAELEAQQGEMEHSVHELEIERDRIQAFHQFVSRLAAHNEIEGLGATLIEELTAVAGADAAALYAIEPKIPDDTDHLRLIASRGLNRGHLDQSLERGVGLAGRALVEEGIVTGSHGESGLELPAFGGNARVHHELHLPIGRPGGMLGVISFAKIGDSGFGAQACERLMEMSGSAGVALANALSLERSEQVAALNQAILESSQDCYVAVDEDGAVLFWNQTAEEIYGVPSEEAVGKRVADLVLPDEESKKGHEERRKQIIATAKRGDDIETYTVWAKRADGSPLHAEVTAAAVESGGKSIVTYFSRDITERTYRDEERAAREAVSETLAELEADADPIPPLLAALCGGFDWPTGGFWEWEEVEKKVHCSRIWIAPDFEFPELEQYAREMTYKPGDSMPAYPVLKQAWDTREATWDAPSGVAKGNDPRAIAHSAGLRGTLALPVMNGTELLGVFTFGSQTDVKPDWQRLMALGSTMELIGQVLGRRRAERDAERLKNEFFALVSHELRTPLTSITGYLEIVRAGDAGEVNDDQRHYLNVIDRNARRLYRLVSDLLFIAQVEAGRMPTNRKSMLDLEETVTEAVDAARPAADKKGVLLSLEASSTKTAGDGERLGQLVDNLISNALKFTPDGGRVNVRLSNGGPNAVIEVADTGMGISEEDQRSLFERFYRTNDAEKLALPGLGLGLSICKAIAEGHGGTISVVSSRGHGTTFRVEIPISKSVTETDVIIAKSNGHERRGALPLPPAQGA